jgi:hypothetical protein
MKKFWIIFGAIILLYIGQFVLFDNDVRRYHEEAKLNRESAKKNLLDQGLAHEQADAIVSLVTGEADNAALHARLEAGAVGMSSFMMAILVLSYAAKEKS